MHILIDITQKGISDPFLGTRAPNSTRITDEPQPPGHVESFKFVIQDPAHVGILVQRIEKLTADFEKGKVS